MRFTLDSEKCVGCGRCAEACSFRIFRVEDGELRLRHPEYCMGCLHCVAACPQGAISARGEGLMDAAPEDGLEELIMRRRSIRHFMPEPPDRALITHALRVASWAPSGKNQKWNGWTLLWGREAVQRAYSLVLDWSRETGNYPELLKQAARGVDSVTCGAPCILIGHNRVDALNPFLDPIIAATTAELVLSKEGLGTCWGGYMRRAMNGWPPLKELAGIAPDREVYALLMVGVPADVAYPNIPARPEPQISWIEK